MNEGQYGKAPSLFMQLHGCLHFISFLFYCFFLTWVPIKTRKTSYFLHSVFCEEEQEMNVLLFLAVVILEMWDTLALSFPFSSCTSCSLHPQA